MFVPSTADLSAMLSIRWIESHDQNVDSILNDILIEDMMNWFIIKFLPLLFSVKQTTKNE